MPKSMDNGILFIVKLCVMVMNEPIILPEMRQKKRRGEKYRARSFFYWDMLVSIYMGTLTPFLIDAHRHKTSANQTQHIKQVLYYSSDQSPENRP